MPCHRQRQPSTAADGPADPIPEDDGLFVLGSRQHVTRREETMTRCLSAGIILTAACIAAPAAAQAPPAGHALVPAYPGSRMEQPAEVSAFDEFDMPTGPIKDARVSKAEHLEGKVTMFEYRSPEGRSTLEVFRNYESGLKAAGFATLFTCKGGQCGEQVGLKGW